MPDISKIKLPGSNNVYDIKDSTARQMISGGVSFIIAWDGTSTPVVADIPAGVVVKYNSTDYTGTLDADDATAGAFYLVKSSTTPSSETLDIYDEYVPVGTTGSKTWEKIGDTQLNLSDVVTDVSLSKSTDVVLGEGTTFSGASSSVSFAAHTTDKVLGEDTTFTGVDPTITVTPSTTYLKATASGGGAAWNSKDSKTVVTGYTIAAANKDTFVKSVSAETNKKMVTTSIPNVTSAGSASTWNFAMGTGSDSETLIISGSNSTAPTLGTAITAATGATAADGTGDSVVTGVTIGQSADAIVSLPDPSTATVIGSSSTFTNTQPTVSLGTESSSATGRVQVATGITSATASGTGVTVGTNDKVSAITALGAGTAAGQTVTASATDKVTVLTNSTDVSVTKGNS